MELFLGAGEFWVSGRGHQSKDLSDMEASEVSIDGLAVLLGIRRWREGA